MIGITITEEIKANNGLSNAIGSIMTRGSYPQRWHGQENVVGGYQYRDDLHQGDGWRDVVQPTIGENQKRGALYYDEENDVFTYEVIDKTEEEIISEATSEAESAQEVFLQSKVRAQVESDLQAIEDDAEIIENQAGYPLWSLFENGFEFGDDFKVQDFDENTVLQVFRIIQPHAKQDDRKPNDTPALWTKIVYSGGIEVWSQPIGGDGKYPYIDPNTGNPYQVEHNGFIWENNHQAGLNVWEPGVFGWTNIGEA